MSAIGTFFIWYMFWRRGPKCEGVRFSRVSQGGHIQHINVGEDIGRSCHIMVDEQRGRLPHINVGEGVGRKCHIYSRTTGNLVSSPV